MKMKKTKIMFHNCVMGLQLMLEHKTQVVEKDYKCLVQMTITNQAHRNQRLIGMGWNAFGKPAAMYCPESLKDLEREN